MIKAWLIKNCPDFYFMAVMRYDRGFTLYDNPHKPKDCPAYWVTVGFIPIPLVECDEKNATHWVVNESYINFDKEAANAARWLGKTVVPVRCET